MTPEAQAPLIAVREMRRRGFRRTEQREAVVRAVFNLAGHHPTARDVHREAASHTKGIGIATVYRTLAILLRLGVVFCLDIGDGRSRYDLRRDRDHHHMICIRCGSIAEVPGQAVSRPELTATGFVVIGSSVCCFGYCPECWQHQDEADDHHAQAPGRTESWPHDQGTVASVEGRQGKTKQPGPAARNAASGLLECFRVIW